MDYCNSEGEVQTTEVTYVNLNDEPPQNFWDKLWNSPRTPLVTTPTISACTTATNLSSLDASQFGPLTTNNRRMGTKEQNLRVAQPEIEPLKTDKCCIPAKEVTNGTTNGVVYNPTVTPKKPKTNVFKMFNQVLTALSVSLVSMGIGYVSAYTSPAQESIQQDLSITKDQYSWVGSLMPLAALVGGLVGGQLIEFIGRKWTIVLTDILFLISWILCANAANVWYLYVGRGIVGFSVGIASLALPVYLGETIQPEVRGTLGLLPTALGNIGILLCFVAGSYLRWNNLAWLGVALPIPFLVLMFFIPETPRWYISKGKDEKAKNSLIWLRGKESDVLEEFEELRKAHQEDEKAAVNASISDLFCKANMKPLMISLGLMFFQQLSGINAVIFYTTDIFEMAGSTIDKKLCTIIVGLVNFISTFIATVLIDKAGRKMLLYVSNVAMIATLVVLGIYFYLNEMAYHVKPYGWLPLASFVIYVLGFSLGFGPIPWLMLGEILPAKIRGSAASIATAFNWACTFLVTKTFPDIVTAIGPGITFWIFAGFCTFSLVFVILAVPETQGQSLQDIERKLAGLKVRRMSSVANMKPMPSTF